MLGSLIEHDFQIAAVRLRRSRKRLAVRRLHFLIVGADQEDEWRVGPVLLAIMVPDLRARRVDGNGGAEPLGPVSATGRTDRHRRQCGGAAVRPSLEIHAALDDIGARAQVFEAGVGVQRSNGDFVDFWWTLLDRARGKACRIAARTKRVDEQDQIAAGGPELAPHFLVWRKMTGVVRLAPAGIETGAAMQGHDGWVWPDAVGPIEIGGQPRFAVLTVELDRLRRQRVRGPEREQSQS